MTTMKRFGLAVLFAIAMAMFTSSPARAQTIDLTPTADASDPDYGATGQATLTDVNIAGYTYLPDVYMNPVELWIYSAQLTVTYEGLTPGAAYQIKATSWRTPLVSRKSQVDASYSYFQFTASANGTGQVTVPVSFSEAWRWIENPDPWLGGHYEQVWGGYIAVSVDRKARNKYIPVLTGYFPDL